MSRRGEKTQISETLVGLRMTATERQRPCLVQFAGEQLGRPFFIKTSRVTIGRDPRAGVRLSEPKVSRQHAVLAFDGRNVVIQDMMSSNGTIVNDRQITQPIRLNNGDLVQIGPVIFKFFAAGSVEQLFYDKIYRQATIDEKTGVFNDKYMMATLKSEIALSLSLGRQLCIILYDLDHFKMVNDRFGHQFGDHVLKGTAAIVSKTIRKNDVLCRYGGEEFLIILPETNMETAVKLAERIRVAVADQPFPVRQEGRRVIHHQTFSLGVARLGSKASIEGLIDRADRKLYESKAKGRNKVTA